MAYLDVAELAELAERSVSAPALSAARAEPRLHALEWAVVALAARDSLASLRAPGRFAAAMNAIFGTRGPNRLADSRLEALRRVAVHAWHRGFAIPASDMQRLFDAGFTSDQFELVVDSVSRARVQARRPRLRASH